MLPSVLVGLEVSGQVDETVEDPAVADQIVGPEHVLVDGRGGGNGPQSTRQSHGQSIGGNEVVGVHTDPTACLGTDDDVAVRRLPTLSNWRERFNPAPGVSEDGKHDVGHVVGRVVAHGDRGEEQTHARMLARCQSGRARFGGTVLGR